MKHQIVLLIIFSLLVASADDAPDDTLFAKLRGNIDKVRIYRYKRHGVERQNCGNDIGRKGISLINEGISKLDSSISIENRFYDAIQDLYRILEAQKTSMKTKIGNYLGQYDEAAKSEGRKRVGAKSDFLENNEFERSFIYTYTSDYVFDDLNKALREHDCTSKDLTHKEKFLAPYAAGLMAVLMHWNKLKSTDKMSYRGSYVTTADMKVYNQSKRIVWLNFASSSTIKNIAYEFSSNVIFYIKNQNSATSRWKPKYICELSKYKNTECEALYPPGAVFNIDHVTKNKENGRYEIKLSLQDSVSSACNIQLHMLNIFSVFTLAYLKYY